MIEDWLVKLEFAMKFSVSQTLIACHASFSFDDFSKWITQWPTHILLAILELNFTERL